MYIDVLKC